jgi:hypothetical protein
MGHLTCALIEGSEMRADLTVTTCVDGSDKKRVVILNVANSHALPCRQATVCRASYSDIARMEAVVAHDHKISV